MKSKRTVSLLLCVAVFIFSSTLLSSAVSYTDNSGTSEVAVSNRAGKNGSNYYDQTSNTVTHIPPDSDLKDMNINVDNINGTVQAIGVGKVEAVTCFVLINYWLYDYIYDNFM